jgi:hypothetical protein
MRIQTAIKVFTCSLFLVPGYSKAEPEANDQPLLTQVHQLYCADNEVTAQQLLEQLQQRELSRQFKLPVEQANQETHLATATLQAGSLDITLFTLVKTAEKYPKLRNLVERTLLKWNYCHVFENQHYYDLYNNQPRKLANYTPPLQWEGFRSLGFLQTQARFIPELLSQSPLGERAFEHFFHRIYREQCFPHPATGDLYHQQRQNFPQRLVIKKTASNLSYPHQWQPQCIDNTQKKTVKKPPPAASIEENKEEDKPVTPLPAPKITSPVTVEETLPQTTTVVEPPVESPQPTTTETKLQKPITAKKVDKKPTPTFDKANLIPPDDFTLPLLAVAPTANSSTPVATVISQKPGETHGFTGNVYVKTKWSDNTPSIGINASWKPIADSYWFIRGNMDYSYTLDDNPLSYSWGIGYDDWHEGSWSVQLNNWGPIKPGEGLAIDKAVGNIGYKFKSDALKKYKLNANASIDIPIDGDPKLNLGLQWNPKENWYIRTALHQPLNGGDPSWSYGFGYSDWRVGKVNIEYANFGPNPLFDDNFEKNGMLSVSYNWEF